MRVAVSAHTPGPWVVWTEDGKFTLVWATSQNVIVARCGTGQTPMPEQQANAALIASVPDLKEQRDELLEALEEMVDDPPTCSCPECPKRRQRARAAIAKAKGEA